MRLSIPTSSGQGGKKDGWALLAVLTVTGATLVMLASAMNWSNENSAVMGRRNEYFATSYAAESATEKVFTAMMQDDNQYGEGYVLQRLTNYAAMLPSCSDDAYFSAFSFSGGTTANTTLVNMMASNVTVTLGAPYTGMTAQGFTYEIISNAKNTNTMAQVPTTVGQKIMFSQIPMFQFAIFYQQDLEIEPGANMSVNGTVHGNQNLYVNPNTGVTLTFSNDVSGSGQVNATASPLDPSSRGTPGTTTYYGTHVSGVNPLQLPSGSGTNTLANGAAILQTPASGSATNGSLLYNQAQMIVMVSNSSITVTSGAANNQATVIPLNQYSLFLSTATNAGFYDQRDGLEINPVKLDVGGLRTWCATNTSLGVVDSIYIADFRSTSNMVIVTNFAYTTNVSSSTNRNTSSSYPSGNYSPPVTTNTSSTTTSSRPASGTYIPPITTNGSGGSKTYTYALITGYSYNVITQSTNVTTNTTYVTNYPVTSQPGIVLTNGATLPSSGLAIATPDPVYIIGNWNVSTNGTPANLGTTDTSQTYPSAIYADAISVLSSNWVNANSTAGISSRIAANDTVNAAFFTGNVPSNGSYYSGGVENFPRFLENWSGYTFTYNGSMVEAFQSQIANYPWPGTGTVYNPPHRAWAFDLNFNNPAKLPPLTPRVVYIQRSAWTLLAPNATSF
jgi:hypothetical protein